MTKANETQVGGEHYRTTDGMQHWDLCAALELDYFQGQITKYVCRWKKKNGVQDLEKAQHFLQKYMEVIKAGSYNVKGPAGDLTYDHVQYCQDRFLVEGHQGSTGVTLYKCRRCGEHLTADNPIHALAKHGECAGPGYVNQG